MSGAIWLTVEHPAEHPNDPVLLRDVVATAWIGVPIAGPQEPVRYREADTKFEFGLRNVEMGMPIDGEAAAKLYVPQQAGYALPVGMGVYEFNGYGFSGYARYLPGGGAPMADRVTATAQVIDRLRGEDHSVPPGMDDRTFLLEAVRTYARGMNTLSYGNREERERLLALADAFEHEGNMVAKLEDAIDRVVAAAESVRARA